MRLPPHLKWNRSISSTTGQPARKKKTAVTQPHPEPTRESPVDVESPVETVRLFDAEAASTATDLLSPDEQEQVWSWLVKGASPQVACQQLRLSLPAFWRTLKGDVQFATALQQLFDTLSHNVLAALYRAAMEGNVTAQQFWLRHRPAREWLAPATPETADDLESLADAELLQQAFAAGAAIPPAVADCLSATSGPEEPGDLPHTGPRATGSDRK